MEIQGRRRADPASVAGHMRREFIAIEPEAQQRLRQFIATL